MSRIHTPVLLEESINGLNLMPTDIVIDGTMGFGGHSADILARIPEGTLIGIDQDSHAINACKERFKDSKNVTIWHGNYADFDKALQTNSIQKVDKVILDLGMSSFQLDHPERGFSFQVDAELDMRMNSNETNTAADILNTYQEDELIRCFVDYGELRRPEKFVSIILDARKKAPITRTKELVQLIKKGFFFRNKRRLYIKTCMQVFQALRIEVNQELKKLESFINDISSYLNTNGRIAIITFHSLEDRLIKRFFINNPDFTPVSKKVIKPSKKEISQNPRSKSAKLRIYIKK